MPATAKIAFVTNFCPHYRVKTYELLAQHHRVTYLFFSAGNEWFWQGAHGVRSGDFEHEYIGGVSLFGTRFTPALPWKLLGGGYDLYIKDLTGRFALPVTYAVARLRRRPIILWTGVWMRLQSRFHRLLYPVTRYIYRHVDAVVVYGDHVKRHLVGEGVSPQRIFVAPHAMDNQRYSGEVGMEALADLRRKLAIDDDARVVLYLGRVVEEKGLSYLVRAFAEVADPDAVLVIAGEGEEKKNLEVLVRELGISERVRFPGYVASEATVAYYALSYVHVLPSVTTAMHREPWGLTINEGFNQGLPAIATDAVGAAAGGLVVDGVTGLVVPERNVGALVVALRRLLGDPSLRQRLSAGAREAIASWDNQRMIAGFLQAIAHVTAARSG